MIPGFLQDAEVGLFWSRGADCDLAAFSSEVKVPISFCFFSSVCHSEEQDPVSNQRLHPDAEDGPDVALHEETQTTVGFLLSFLCSSLLLFFPYLCPSLSSHFHPFILLNSSAPLSSAHEVYPPFSFLLHLYLFIIFFISLFLFMLTHPSCSPVATHAFSSLSASFTSTVSRFPRRRLLCDASALLITTNLSPINNLPLHAASLAAGCAGECDYRGQVGVR